jgi:hypothetical protein
MIKSSPRIGLDLEHVVVVSPAPELFVLMTERSGHSAVKGPTPLTDFWKPQRYSATGRGMVVKRGTEAHFADEGRASLTTTTKALAEILKSFWQTH